MVKDSCTPLHPEFWGAGVASSMCILGEWSHRSAHNSVRADIQVCLRVWGNLNTGSKARASWVLDSPSELTIQPTPCPDCAEVNFFRMDILTPGRVLKRNNILATSKWTLKGIYEVVSMVPPSKCLSLDSWWTSQGALVRMRHNTEMRQAYCCQVWLRAQQLQLFMKY